MAESFAVSLPTSSSRALIWFLHWSSWISFYAIVSSLWMILSCSSIKSFSGMISSWVFKKLLLMGAERPGCWMYCGFKGGFISDFWGVPFSVWGSVKLPPLLFKGVSYCWRWLRFWKTIDAVSTRLTCLSRTRGLSKFYCTLSFWIKFERLSI